MKEVLEYQLFRIGEYTLYVHNILEVLLVIAVAKLLMVLLAKGISKNTRIDPGARYSIRQLVKYILFVVVALLSITLLGFDLSVLFVGSAALLVGIGFGLQSLFADFISGIIILFDNTIKVNDVIEVDGIVCRVKEIKIRTTTVMTREDKCIILPNSVITGGKVVNWTYSQLTSRFEIVVPLAFTSNVPEIMAMLKTVTLEHRAVSRMPEPSIRITRFADFYVEITVMFWCSEVFRVENIKSELRVMIYKALRENNVEFPLPQRIVQMKSE